MLSSGLLLLSFLYTCTASRQDQETKTKEPELCPTVRPSSKDILRAAARSFLTFLTSFIYCSHHNRVSDTKRKGTAGITAQQQQMNQDFLPLLCPVLVLDPQNHEK